MNKTTSIIRLSILGLLFAAAFALLFCNQPDSCIFIVKALALALFLYAGRLFSRWSRVDPWLKAYTDKCDEIMDAPESSAC